MDYTSYDQVMQAIGSKSTELSPAPDETRVKRMITAASRVIDRECTGVVDPDAVDYFKLETKTDEALWGQVDRNQKLWTYPHKPIITAVTALSYKASIKDDWTSVDPTEIAFMGPRVEAYPTGMLARNQRVWVKITYQGGLGATLETLPADLIELANLLTARFYREDESGLTDAIGVAELGTLVYTKAMPARFRDLIRYYKRRVGWSNIA